ncbi:hypothetical protein [Ferrimonas sp.]|uniref:hypothetical protein n=1 Tax=Ferrimonas sp. TaxID=2080861 RepID=UPI003A8EC276
MIRAVVILLATILVTLIILVPLGQRSALDLTFNCRNELYDVQGQGESEHYLIADVVLQDDRASMNLRYFDLKGEPHSTINLTGQVSRASFFDEVYELAINKVDTRLFKGSEARVNHMQYMSGFTKSNLSNLGSHNLTIRVLDRELAQGYWLFFIQPSNSVVACSVIE